MNDATSPVVGCDGRPVADFLWDFHERMAEPYRAPYASGRGPAKRSDADTDELVGALLVVAGRLGDEERATIPFLERRGDDPDDAAARIVAEHGFSDLRLQAFRGLARSRNVDLETVLRAALRGALREIVELPPDQREASAD